LPAAPITPRTRGNARAPPLHSPGQGRSTRSLPSAPRRRRH